jgi:hypothetical protein
VTVATGGEFAVSSNQFTISASTATIAGISTTPATTPPSGAQGTNSTVTLNGSNTHWTSGGTAVTFGAGINVGGITSRSLAPLN